MIANYAKEQQQFSQLITPGSSQRILMVRGASGIGKSHFMDHCLGTATLPTIPVQMKGGATPIHQVLYRLGRGHGWERLPRFCQMVAKIHERPDAYRDLEWLGLMRHHLRQAVETTSADSRRSRHTQLTSAFFQDAQAFEEPTLLAIDTYEQATAEFDRWLRDDFLSWVADTANMRVLVAGQKVPELSGDWGFCSSYHELQGVADAQEWLPVAQAMGYQVPSVDYLAGICKALNGNPGQILAVIRTLPQLTEEPMRPQQNMAERRSQWRQYLVDFFDLLDLREICFDMSIEVENLQDHTTRRGLALSLMSYVDKRGRLPELIDLCRRHRPHLEW